MPIRPIDMQVAIPKMSEVSRMKHLEQQKAGLHQDQNAASTKKSVDTEARTVSHSEKDAKSSSDADARKKGRNEYTNLKKNRKKEEDKKAAGPKKSQNKIDIRI